MSHILVVEDESAIAELISINLRHAGYEVTIAGTADQAQFEVDRVLPDLVVLDWMLPGQTGLALAKRWRSQARTKDLPVNDLAFESELAIKQLRKALDAFARLDIEKAVEVLKQDDQIDQEFEGLMRKLITFMMEDPRTISSSIDLIFVAKAIERVGDHAKNLAEVIIYVVKGTDVRHNSVADVENMVR